MKVTIGFNGNKPTKTYENYDRMHFTSGKVALIKGDYEITLTDIAFIEVRD